MRIQLCAIQSDNRDLQCESPHDTFSMFENSYFHSTGIYVTPTVNLLLSFLNRLICLLNSKHRHIDTNQSLATDASGRLQLFLRI